MARFKTVQRRFTQGELDPKMIGRADVDQYYGAVALARNVFPLPQGGFSRRSGLEYIYTLPNKTLGGVGNCRLIDFVFNVDDTYLLALTEGKLNVFLNGAHVQQLTLSGITDDMVLEVDWVQSADTLLLFHEDIQTLKIIRDSGTGVWSSSNVSWENIPTYDFGGVAYGSITMTPSATSGSVTLTASSSIFTASMVGWVYRSFDRNGYARITGYTSGTVVNATVIDAFDSTTASSDYALEEPLWSSTRGYPRHGVFHQGRLFVDGGRSRPSVAYGSVVNDFFNFNFGTALADQAIGPLGGGELNPIQSLYSSTSLMVFTSGGEYVAQQTLGDPLTPANASLTQQSKIGMQANVRPQEADGGVLYVQRGGRSVQEFLFDDTQNRYANSLISLLSNHLITGITHSAMRKATSADDGSYLLLVRDDGNLIVANILSRQNVASFAMQTTDGVFKACGVDKDDMYFAIKRTINGNEVLYLERFNSSFTTDCAKEYTTSLPEDTFTTLSHLEGKEVFVLADGNLLSNETVTGGQITIDREAETRCEIGLNYTPIVKDLPPENEQLGTVYGQKINIGEVVLDLLETKHITVAVGDGSAKEVSFRNFGLSILDTETPSFTGRHRMVGWRGWDDTGQVTISQVYPLPMTVLAIAKRVSV